MTAAAASPLLSVVIVSYNCRDLLEQCLNSIYERKTDLSFEVIVVDNASADGVTDFLAQSFPRVTCIANRDNEGFSRANNRGFAAARGQYLMVLNPDTALPTDHIMDQFVAHLQQNPAVGAVGPELTDPHGNKQVGAGYAPSPWSFAAFCWFLSKLSNNRIRGLSLLPVKDAAVSEVAVDWLCAACMVVRREVLDTMGGFDERYFLYGEDIEWGCRMSDHGWLLHHLPGVRVHHLERGTQEAEGDISSAWLDGMARIYFERDSSRSWLLFKSLFVSGLAMRWCGYRLLSLVTNKPWHHQRRREMVAWFRHALAMSRESVSKAATQRVGSHTDTMKADCQ